jgi:hypothetical protein
VGVEPLLDSQSKGLGERAERHLES